MHGGKKGVGAPWNMMLLVWMRLLFPSPSMAYAASVQGLPTNPISAVSVSISSLRLWRIV